MRKDKVVSEVFGEEVALTPSDLYSKQFKSALFGGYKPEGVHQFLERVADVLEELIVQVRVLKEQLSQQGGRLEEYRQMEETLRDALVSSRSFGEDILESAKREALTLTGEARLVKAKAHLEAAKLPALLSRDIQLLMKERHRLRSEMMAILDTHRNLLESLVPEPVATENLAIDISSAEETERLIEEARKVLESRQDTPATLSSEAIEVDSSGEMAEPDPVILEEEAPTDEPEDVEPEAAAEVEVEELREGVGESTEEPEEDETPDIADAGDAPGEEDEDQKAAASGIMLSSTERALLTDSETIASSQPADSGGDASENEDEIVLGEPLDEGEEAETEPAEEETGS